MKAITVTEDKKLELTTAPIPTVKPGEVLVKVHAAGVNRADLLQAAGHYPPPTGESEIIGLECAGVIEDAGTTNRTVGEKVGCLLAGGGYAEYVAVPEGQLLPIPDGYSFEQTAAIIEVAATVWSNIGMLTGLEAGQTFLIHGGGSGIGTFAIQLAKHLGATVAVTAGSAEKLAVCQELGADILINYREENFAEVLKNRCDRILDIIGAKYLDQNVTALAPDGHMVTIGMQGGVKGELNIGKLLSKRGTISATSLRGRTKEDKARITAATVAAIWPLLADGTITHQLHAVLPRDDAQRAHDMLAAGEVTGKLVLKV